MSSPLAYADLADKKNELIRKALNGSGFLAPHSAAAITTLTTGSAAGLMALPTDYGDAGYLTSDGVDVAAAITSVDIDSWGSAEPTRSDITKKTTTVKFIAQETKKSTIGLYTNTDMSVVTADPTTGEVSIEEAPIPSPLFHRFLSLAVDENDSGEIYIGRFLPRCKITNVDNQKFANLADAVQYGVTMTAYVDSALGYSSRFLFGGPGWKAILTDMGF